jgi:hypothetical protein
MLTSIFAAGPHPKKLMLHLWFLTHQKMMSMSEVIRLILTVLRTFTYMRFVVRKKIGKFAPYGVTWSKTQSLSEK